MGGEGINIGGVHFTQDLEITASTGVQCFHKASWINMKIMFLVVTNAAILISVKLISGAIQIHKHWNGNIVIQWSLNNLLNSNIFQMILILNVILAQMNTKFFIILHVISAIIKL